MVRWLAVGADTDGLRACLSDGDTLLEQGLFPNEESAHKALGARDCPVIRIGGTAPQATPVAVLPAEGTALASVTRDTPPEALGGWARLRIAGVLASRRNWDGVIVDTGAHSTHWVHVSADEIVSFQGAATPRLIAALGGATGADETAAESTLSRPERLATHLHSADLTGDTRAITGHLLGAEVAAAKPYWLGQEVIVLSASDTHAALLRRLGSSATTSDPDTALAHGLAALAARRGLAE